MATRAKKHPEIELPNVFIKAITDYYGIRTINKLSSQQKSVMMRITTEMASSIGNLIEHGPEPTLEEYVERLQLSHKTEINASGTDDIPGD